MDSEKSGPTVPHIAAQNKAPASLHHTVNSTSPLTSLGAPRQSPSLWLTLVETVGQGRRYAASCGCLTQNCPKLGKTISVAVRASRTAKPLTASGKDHAPLCIQTIRK